MGEVRQPGTYPLSGDMSLVDLRELQNGVQSQNAVLREPQNPMTAALLASS